MAKKKELDKIETVFVEDVMKTDYLEYALSVIKSRSIPLLVDGLKPVQRRILWAMRNADSYSKSARHVGEVLGKYHPHGEASVYDTMVRMAQDWKMYVPLVDGHGNFGSIDGDSAAAMRYCITGDTIIDTVDYGHIPIKRLAEGMEPNSDRVIDISVKSAFGKINKADRIFHSGKHPIYKMILRNGMELRGTENHPVLTLSRNGNYEWKLLREISVDDNVIVDSNLYTLPKNIIENNIEEARFYGAIISEGYVTTENRIGINNTDFELVRVVKDFVNPNAKISMRSLHNGKTIFEYLTTDKALVMKLERDGFGRDSHSRDIPSWLFHKSEEYICEFLRYLYEGDGSVSVSSKNKKNGTSIVYVSASKNMIRSIQRLLLSLSIESFISYGTSRPNEHRLIISGKSNIERFVGKIGFVSERKIARAHEAVSKVESNIVTYNSAYTVHVDQMPRFNVGTMTNESGFIYLQPNVEKFIKIYETMKDMYRHSRASRVRSIEVTGLEEDVFSIRVCSECHSFITNGIVSHNTEARLERSAKDLYFTYNQLGIEYEPNYDNKEKEPEFLSCPLPMVLVNGSYGTAVGFATSIPAHNPKEVASAYLAFIDGKLTNKNITKYLKGPDNPYPCKIIDKGGIERAYQTGKGSYYCVMDYHLEDASYGRTNIVFDTVLPMTDKTDIINKMVQLVRGEKFGLHNLISDIRDESSQGDIRIIVTTKKGANVDTLLEKLVEAKVIYDRFNISIVVIVNDCPRVLGIMDLFTEFHKMQRKISERHLSNTKGKLLSKLELLDGIVVAIKNYDKVASLIKNSKSKEDARDKIKKAFKGLNDNQVNAILETKLINLINKGDAIITEQKEIKAQIKNIDVTLKDIDTYIKNNINELLLSLKPYNRRRSTIIKEESNGSK